MLENIFSNKRTRAWGNLYVGNPKVVLIDKVVLGSPKKGDGNWQYFWVQVLCRQHLWVQKFEEKSGKFKIQIYIFAGL